MPLLEAGVSRGLALLAQKRGSREPYGCLAIQLLSPQGFSISGSNAGGLRPPVVILFSDVPIDL